MCGKDAQYISEPLKEGALYESFYLPGGGGYGDPLDRRPAEVERDVNHHFVSARAAGKLYATVGKTGRDGEWRADPASSQRVRARVRKARLSRAVPVKDWWRAERRQILGKKRDGAVAAMYSQCLARSENWARGYREFWALPKDFTFSVDQEGETKWPDKQRCKNRRSPLGRA